MRRLSVLTLVLLLLVSHALGEKTLTLTFTGDVTLGSEEHIRPRPTSFESLDAENGHDYFMANFMDLFSADDQTIINLEGVLSDSSRGENTQKQYRFRGPAYLADILVQSSIEAANISNNHAMDYGNQGFESTKEVLEKAGVAYFGYSQNYIMEKDGLRIAFYGIVSPKFQSLWPRCREEIQALKAEGVNAVVLVFHAGQEYGRHRNSMQENFARKAIDAGADLVIMHHPHVLQGLEIYKDRSICYSLGNFCFGGNTAVRALQTAVVQADLTFDDDGRYLGQLLRIYPAHISGDSSVNNFQPVRVSGAEAEAVMKLIQDDTGFDLVPYDEELGYAPQSYVPAQTVISVP